MWRVLEGERVPLSLLSLARAGDEGGLLEADGAIGHHEGGELSFGFSDERLELRVVDLVGEGPAADLRVHPGA